MSRVGGSPVSSSTSPAMTATTRARLVAVLGRRPGGVNLGLLIALVVLFVGLSVFSPYFFSPTNLLNIGRATAIVGIASVGETIVIISGGFDLSVGSVMAAAGMLAAFLVGEGVPLPLAFAAAIAIGMGVGLVNGAIVGYARINPLIATLATLSIVRGLSYVLSGGQEIVVEDTAWVGFGTDTFLSIPYIVIVLLAAFLVAGLAMPRTPFGRYAYAIGSSARASRLAGVAVNRWRLAFYVTCGGLAALAGLVAVARIGYAQPSGNAGIELDVITAVILGGTSLTGGRGTILGTLVGLALIGVINNGLTLTGVPAYWQLVVKGGILLAAVLYDEMRRARQEET
jgi:ribose/xylose/arabinose/galactoside ABC-type transport system permease subunit